MVQGSPPSLTLIANGRLRAVSQKWPQAESGERKGRREGSGREQEKLREKEVGNTEIPARGSVNVTLVILGDTWAFCYPLRE